jgi:hypothetical protein
MTIRQQGGVFGRHPKFESIEVDGQSDLGPITVTDATLPVTVNRTGGNGRHATFQDNGSDRGGIAEHDFDLYFGTPSSGIRVSRFNSYIGPRTVDNGGATLDLGAPATNQWRNLYLSGNVILGTAGAGIDFSATAGTGTSELFDDYEEGTWTPADGSPAGLTFTNVTGVYTKIGRMVFASARFTYPTTADGAVALVSGLPFTAATLASNLQSAVLARKTDANTTNVMVNGGQTTFSFWDASGNGRLNSDLSGDDFRLTVIYSV